MTNNDILRRVRYLFELNENQMIALFKLAEHKVEKTEMSAWLQKPDAPSLVEITDKELAIFLNGLIIEKRGKREGPLPKPEDTLTNNMILQKLKIALNLTSDDILALFASVDTQIYKNELSAFFRKPNHRLYRPCLDQYLRQFLNALQMKNKKKQGE